MGCVSDTIRNHHRELANALSVRVEAILRGTPEADPDALADFLRRDLLPHALGEEQYLYPAVDPLVSAYGHATATMSIDHEYIEGYIDWIRETAGELKTADLEERPALLALLQRLCLQLEAVLQVHLAKEERVYLPLLETYVAEEEQQRILQGMHKEYEVDPYKDDRQALYAGKAHVPAA